MQFKVNVHPAACGNTKWRGVAWSLPWRGVRLIWVGAIFLQVRKVGDQKSIMVYARLYSCYIVLPAKSEKWKW